MLKRQAFTLMEMLVVIAIITLLLSITQPSLSRAKLHARVVECQINMNSHWLAQTTLADDNAGKFWRHDDYSPDYARSGGAPDSLWEKLTKGKYMSDFSITICPVIKNYPGPSITYDGTYRTYIDHTWAGSDYAGFGTQAPQILTVYAWFANYRHGYGSTTSGAATIYLTVGGETERAWPRTMSEAGSDRAFSAHRISGGPVSTAHHDEAHLGLGLGRATAAELINPNESQPVSFGDGHVILRPRSQIRERVHIPIGNVGYFYY